MHRFKVERDKHGFAIAIALGPVYVLHLNPGTARNEENVERIVWLLNRVVEANTGFPSSIAIMDIINKLKETICTC